MESIVTPLSVRPPPLVIATVWPEGVGPLAMALNPTLSALVTNDGGGATVTSVLPLLFPIRAVMLALPTAIPFATPREEIVTAAGLSLDQSAFGPTNGMPARFSATASSRRESPATRVGAAGAT